MPEASPADHRGVVSVGDAHLPSSTGSCLTTSVYQTRLGLVSLTWSQSLLGLSLCVELRLSAAPVLHGGNEDELLRFRVRPWLFWKRRGSKHFPLKDHLLHLSVDVAWDLGGAKFPASDSPEPASGFYVYVAVDGEVLVVAGDLSDEACRRSKSKRPSASFSRPVLISRREHAKFREAGGGRRRFTTTARFGGRQREISIDLDGRGKDQDAAMTFFVDGEAVLDVRRLRWKFRGSEKIETKDSGGGWIQISWDLHSWLFQPKNDAASDSGAVTGATPPAADLGQAIFIFRFEPDDGKEGEGNSGKKMAGNFRDEKIYRETAGGFFGKHKIWSDSSSGGGGKEERLRSRRRRREDLRKASSSSSLSTSSVSSGGGSTVMEWESPEEVELHRAGGFSLLVYTKKI